MTYRFTPFLEDVEVMTDEVADRLFEAGCNDATPFSRSGEAAVGSIARPSRSRRPSDRWQTSGRRASG